MNLLILNVFLAFVWAALFGEFTLQQLIVGFIIGYATLYSIRGAMGENLYFFKGNQFVRFMIYFIWELFIANLRVARDVLRPGPIRMKPHVVAVPLDTRNEIAITILANVLSLTPGTLSLDISDDRSVLFVHAINADDPDQVRAQTKAGFERLVIDLVHSRKEKGPSDDHEVKI
jgi:multicomponent Na+:H+ antiporter subunit E